MNDDDRSIHPEKTVADPPPSPEPSEQPLGSIALRQVRVHRADGSEDAKSPNLMNRLVPYLDLFGRLSDEELGRLASVPPAIAANLRRQVVQVDRALTRFTDLLGRLTDTELVRLTGATPKTVRFWRLCQPRGTAGFTEATDWSVAQAAETLGRVRTPDDLVRTSPPEGAEPGSPQSPNANHRPEAGPTAPSYDSGVRALDELRARSAQTSSPEHRDDHRPPTGRNRWPRTRPNALPPPVDLPPPVTAMPEPSSPSRTGHTELVPAATPTPSLHVGAVERPTMQTPSNTVMNPASASGKPLPPHEIEPPPHEELFSELELPDPQKIPHPGRRAPLSTRRVSEDRDV